MADTWSLRTRMVTSGVVTVVLTWYMAAVSFAHGGGTTETVTARGLAAIPGPHVDNGLIVARDRARGRAEASLLRRLHALGVAAATADETTIRQGDTTTSRRRISGVLTGARILAEGRVSTGLYEVVMGVSLIDGRVTTIGATAGPPIRARPYIDGMAGGVLAGPRSPSWDVDGETAGELDMSPRPK